MKTITVNLKGGLHRYLELPLQVVLQRPDGDKIASLLAYLNLEKSMLAVLLQNGEQVDTNEVIKDEAVIDLYPLFGGG